MAGEGTLGGGGGVLGGIYVEVRADTTKFKSDIANIKQQSQQAAQQLAVNVPVRLGGTPSAVSGSTSAGSVNSGSAVAGTAGTGTNYGVNTGAVLAQFPALPAPPSRQMLMLPGPNRQVPLLPGPWPSEMGVPAGGLWPSESGTAAGDLHAEYIRMQGFDPIKRLTRVSSKWQFHEGRPMGMGGYSSGESPVVSGGPMQMYWGPRGKRSLPINGRPDEGGESRVFSLGRFARELSLGFAAFEGARIGNEYSNYLTSMASSRTGEQQYSAQMGFINSVSNVPIFGQAAEAFAVNVPGHFNWLKFGKPGDSGKSGRDILVEASNAIERARVNDEQTSRMTNRATNFQSISNRLELAHQTLGMSSGVAGVSAAQQSLSIFDAQYGVENGDTSRLKASGKRARKAILQSIEDAMQSAVSEAVQEIGGGRVAAGGIMLGGSTALSGATNGSVAASRMELIGQNNLAQQSIQNQIDTLIAGGASPNDPRVIAARGNLSAQQQAGPMRLKAFDIGQQSSLTRFRGDYALRQEFRSARMRGDTYTAGKLGIVSDYAPQLESAMDAYGPQSEQVNTIWGERDQSIADYTRSSIEDRLRSGRRGRMVNRNAQRSRDYDDAAFGRSITSRIAVAGALGNNQPEYAGILGRISEMREEKIAAPSRLEGKVAQAQFAELQAIEKQIMMPHNYATQFDPTRNVTGGPTGDSGKEIVNMLTAIRDYMKQLVESGGVTASALSGD